MAYSINKFFTSNLLKWYQKFGRKNLPWQKNLTPYRVWVSEIMLQQTQVTTVIDYYLRFMKSFPNLKSLATASDDAVMQHWAGLGYYSRARNLHKTAKIIVEQHAGRFPTDIDQVIALPGIGQSTASAILAFSKGQRHAILDGNVKRVLTRFFAIEGYPEKPAIKKQLWEIADTLTPNNNIKQYTQAIMDLGASICSRTPQCKACPVAKKCQAYQTNTTEKFPTKKPKKKIPTKEQGFLILLHNNKILLEKRPNFGIWGGLWCLPEDQKHVTNKYDVTIVSQENGKHFNHTFSHYKLIGKPTIIKVKNVKPKACDQQSYQWIDLTKLNLLGLPAPITKYLKEIT